MTKKLVLVSVSILLLAASCAKKPAMQNNENAQPTGQEQSKKQQKSMRDIMSMGGSQKCTITLNRDNVSSDGTIYVSGGKMRADMSAMVNGKTMQTHLIVKDGTTYSWVDGSTMGFKVAANEKATENSSGKSNATHAPDLNQQVTYNCAAWTAVESLFNLPSGVNFSGLNSLNPAMMNGNSASLEKLNPDAKNPNSKEQMCAACDNAGTGKAQCLAALHCN